MKLGFTRWPAGSTLVVACFLPLSPLAQTAPHADRSVDAQASALAAQAQADWKRQAIDRDSLNRVTGDIASLRQDETSLREKGALTGLKPPSCGIGWIGLARS